jgi:hypothetical protein
MKGKGPRPGARRLGSNPRSGRNNADEHFSEMVGSSDFWIYLAPDTPLKGYDELRKEVEAHGCTIRPATDAPVNMGPYYMVMKIKPREDALVPVDLLKLAHRWAHQHDFLHSFFKPTR